jgi:hypothetical protein
MGFDVCCRDAHWGHLLSQERLCVRRAVNQAGGLFSQLKQLALALTLIRWPSSENEFSICLKRLEANSSETENHA